MFAVAVRSSILVVAAVAFSFSASWAQKASAQKASSPTTCVVAANAASSPAIECFREPAPRILDDTRPDVSPRKFEFRGDGRVVPYPAR